MNCETDVFQDKKYSDFQACLATSSLEIITLPKSVSSQALYLVSFVRVACLYACSQLRPSWKMSVVHVRMTNSACLQCSVNLKRTKSLELHNLSLVQ